jgi:hypothetical protein
MGEGDFADARLFCVFSVPYLSNLEPLKKHNAISR